MVAAVVRKQGGFVSIACRCEGVMRNYEEARSAKCEIESQQNLSENTPADTS